MRGQALRDGKFGWVTLQDFSPSECTAAQQLFHVVSSRVRVLQENPVGSLGKHVSKRRLKDPFALSCHVSACTK